MFKNVRFSSSLAKLWIKQPNASKAIQVSTTGCVTVNDLINMVKKELLLAFDSKQTTLHKSLSDPALERNFQISSISAAGLTAQAPLFVKTPETSTNMLDRKLQFKVQLMQKEIQLKEKEFQLTVQLMKKEIQSKEKELKSEIQSKEKEFQLIVQSMQEDIQLKEKELQLKDELMQKDIKLYNARISRLQEEKENETLYKLHYQQQLIVRGFIEEYEKNFGENIRKMNISRMKKWKVYLQSKTENFKPFEKEGFTVEDVCIHVDNICKSLSADIFLLKSVKGRVKGRLTDDQMKFVKIIVELSQWRGLISIE